jgi:hypothetical protein
MIPICFTFSEIDISTSWEEERASYEAAASLTRCIVVYKLYPFLDVVVVTI